MSCPESAHSIGVKHNYTAIHIEDIYHISIKATHSFELTLNNGLQLIFIPTNTTNRHKGSTYVTIR